MFSNSYCLQVQIWDDRIQNTHPCGGVADFCPYEKPNLLSRVDNSSFHTHPLGNAYSEYIAAYRKEDKFFLANHIYYYLIDRLKKDKHE